jgi:hypothetical protein
MTERDVGIAISGGGHRATVFGLGALLAVVDSGLNREVASISSVSGGSIANGITMTGPDYGTVDGATFEAHISPALRAIATRGVLGRSAPRTAGYLRFLVIFAVASLAGILGIAVFVISRVWAGAVVSCLVAIGGQGMAWRLFRQRSARAELAIDDELFGGRRLSLGEVKEKQTVVHHVIVATELQTGEPFYFTNRGVYGSSFGWGSGDFELTLATAVQASASVPGAFAPRAIKLSDLGIKTSNRLSTIVVDDGAIYDNLADEWEYGHAARLRASPRLAEIQPRSCTYLVVVNGSRGWTGPKPIGSGGFEQEFAGLSRAQAVQYEVATAHRRRTLFERFSDEDTASGGAFVQIGDSPYRTPTIFAAKWVHDSTPSTASRAQEALAFLNAQGYTEAWWDAVVKSTSAIATTLTKLGTEPTAQLLEHGYVLTMVNLYVMHGQGQLLPIDRGRFRTLCA